jgi:hypothetical protein
VEVEHGRRWRGTAGNSGRRCCRGSEGRAEHVPEEEEEGRRSEGPRWKLQKPQGLHCKQNFSTDPKSNEEMVKIEVVELFKSYSLDLGLKFRNLKYIALFYTFALNSNLIKFLSLEM